MPTWIDPDAFREKQEKLVLFGTLLVVAGALLFFTTVSMGTVGVVLAISALFVKIRQGQLLGSSVLVTQDQFPRIHGLVSTATERLGMQRPDVFICENRSLNAFAIGVLGKKSVVLHSATVEAMTDDELLYILGHELSHIKCGHTAWITVTSSATSVLRIPILSDILGFAFLWWSRKAEYTSDRGGLLANRNLGAALSALAKLAVGVKLFEQLNLEALAGQIRNVEQDEVSKLAKALATHPYLVHRIQALKGWNDAAMYQKLIA